MYYYLVYHNVLYVHTYQIPYRVQSACKCKCTRPFTCTPYLSKTKTLYLLWSPSHSEDNVFIWFKNRRQAKTVNTSSTFSRSIVLWNDYVVQGVPDVLNNDIIAMETGRAVGEKVGERKSRLFVNALFNYFIKCYGEDLDEYNVFTFGPKI